MRKVRKTLADSAIRVVTQILEENEIPHEINKSDRTLRFPGPAGLNEILFNGLDDPEKIKSIKAISSIWIEEATEFTKDDFLKVDLTLREPGPWYKQMILSFNPEEAKAPWLKAMFFGSSPYPDSRVHVSTVEDNPIREVRESYLQILEGLRDQDEALYKIARHGIWATRSGQIFSWDVCPLPTDVAFDEIWYGGDFGYSVDPAAVLRIYRRADEFWLEELVYKTNLTNQDLAEEMFNQGYSSQVAYFDSAEPKSIRELQKSGIKARPALKGPDSVRAGIDFLKSKRIHIVEGSENLYREHNNYCWRKDRDGNNLPEPVNFDDHLMAAARYGIFSHCSKPKAKVWSAQWGA